MYDSLVNCSKVNIETRPIFLFWSPLSRCMKWVHFILAILTEVLQYSWQTLVLSAVVRIRRAWDRLASRRARMASGVSIRAAPKRPFMLGL